MAVIPDDDYSSFDPPEPEKPLSLPADFGTVLAGLNGDKGAEQEKLGVAKGANVKILSSEPVATPLPSNLKKAFNAAASANSGAPQIGELVRGKGIYIGVWKPDDLYGKPLNKIFDLYAAPEDLKGIDGTSLNFAFKDAVERMGELKNWHGHDGLGIDDAMIIINSAENTPELLSDWFIPTISMLNGKDARGVDNNDRALVQKDNLYDHNQKMPAGTQLGEPTTDVCYWSCSRSRSPSMRARGRAYYSSSMSVRNSSSPPAVTPGLLVRPVRAELRL